MITYEKTVSILLMVVIMAMCVSVSAQSNVRVTLDGNEIYFPDAKPFIDERDRVLVSILSYLIIRNKKMRLMRGDGIKK